MVSVNIDMKQITDAVIESAKVTAESRLKLKVGSVLNDYFSDGSGFRETKGLGYELIQKRVEDFLISPEFEKLIDEKIALHMDEAAGEAVKVLMKSKSRKHLFTAVEDK